MREIKLGTPLDKDCLQHGVYPDNVVESQVKAVEQKLGLVILDFEFENITSENLKSAAEMFLYLIFCPGTNLPWFIFYKELLQTQTTDQIILTLNRIMKSTKAEENAHFETIAQKLFKRVTVMFDLKYPEIQRYFFGQSINISFVKNDTIKGVLLYSISYFIFFNAHIYFYRFQYC